MKNNIKRTLITLGIATVAAAALAQDSNNNGQSMPARGDANAPLTSQHFVWEAAMIDLQEIQLGELALQKSDNYDVKHFAEYMIVSHKKACKKLRGIVENEGLQFPDTNSLAMNTDGRQNGNDDWNANANANADSNGYSPAEHLRGEDSRNKVPAADPTLDASASADTVSNTTAEIPRGQGSVNTSGTPNSTMDANAGTDNNTYTTTENPRGQRVYTNLDNDIGNHAIDLNALSGTAFDRAYALKMVDGHERAIRKFEVASAELQDVDLKKYADKTLRTLRSHLQLAEELKSKVGMLTDTTTTSPDLLGQNK
jgi:predicted outer membrane protein